MRSDLVKKGATRSAHRALFNAMGYGPEDLKKPLVGIVNAFNEIIPGHIHLRTIADAAKLGVAAAGGDDGGGGPASGIFGNHENFICEMGFSKRTLVWKFCGYLLPPFPGYCADHKLCK